MSPRTLEQRRASHALECVRSLEPDDELRKRYRAYVERLGPAIVMNGLGQALAAERAAAGRQPEKPEQKAHDLLYRNVQQWLCRADGGVYAQAPDVLEAIVQGDQALYLRAQAEALAWMVWHKKLCRAELPRGEASGD